MSAEAYRLPDLLSLLPTKPCSELINPHFSEVETSFYAQIEKFGVKFTTKAKKCDAPIFVAALYPLATYEQLLGMINFSASAFLIDDVIDRCPKEDALAVAESWMSLLLDADATKPTECPLIEAIHSELLPSIREVIDPFHWPRFVNETQKMIAEMVAEAHSRGAHVEESTVPDIKSLLASRRLTIGAYPYFVFLRSSRSLYIPDDIITHPLVREMETTLIDFLIITNDIYSFKKEFSFDKAFGNILTLIRQDPEKAHLDFQGVLDYAETLGREILDRFATCVRNLPSFSPEIDQYLISYVDGLMDIAVGNVLWSAVTCRYSVFENDEDERNNIVRLSL